MDASNPSCTASSQVEGEAAERAARNTPRVLSADSPRGKLAAVQLCRTSGLMIGCFVSRPMLNHPAPPRSQMSCFPLLFFQRPGLLKLETCPQHRSVRSNAVASGRGSALDHLSIFTLHLQSPSSLLSNMARYHLLSPLHGASDNASPEAERGLYQHPELSQPSGSPYYSPSSCSREWVKSSLSPMERVLAATSVTSGRSNSPSEASGGFHELIATGAFWPRLLRRATGAVVVAIFDTAAFPSPQGSSLDADLTTR
ncbi:hypothetical protein F5884DRAFT_6179 [Xylogone sp. PMI_703]|nr:hypothetical protein F5884DRAFT_6179 [Xylogone sp. PMI_703]